MLDMLWKFDRAMGLREIPSKMHSRRIAARKQADEPFDKCTSEYYSCGRKLVHGKHCVRELRRQFPSDSMLIAPAKDNGAGDVHGHSSACLDTDGSDVSSTDADDAKLQHVSRCGSSSCSQNEGFCDKFVELGMVNGGLSDSKEKQINFDMRYSSTESLPLFKSGVDCEGNKTTGANFSVLSGNGICIHDFATVCDVGLGLNEENNEWGASMPALSLSPARGGHRRMFPPPLSSVAMHDKRRPCPNACSAGSCLRSFRCNGRFVLQEVKAATHKYFRVLRGDGRLKLELVNAEDDSSAEEDGAGASDVCENVEKPASDVCESVENSEMVEMVGGPSGTVKVCDKDACVGSTSYSSTCIASSQVEKLMPLDSRAGSSSEQCPDLVDKPATNAEKGLQPLFCVVPGALSMSEAKAIASESPNSSPRCIESSRVLYNDPSPRMKSSWVRPISAF